MKQLVCYSVSLPTNAPRLDLLWQLEASVRSLRAYNRAIPIVVFVYGDVPAELRRELAPHRVHVRAEEPYEARLARYMPRGWQALARYPVLHRWMNFRSISSFDPDQILQLDCDTFFAGDVALLFDQYSAADCYAREEPTCARSHHGYDPEYLDESALARIASANGIRTPPPFNLGIVMWNNRVWHRFPQLDQMILHYTWRFLVWMALNPAQGAALGYGESEPAQFLAQHFESLATEQDVRELLPYPSANRWIVEQVALWCTLGHVPHLTYSDFSSRHVLQNGEFASDHGHAVQWIVCHYFSQNLEGIDAWLRARASSATSRFSARTSWDLGNSTHVIGR